jgi:stage II sporulation protein AA (anti-sigma F factor antagonist)
MTAAGPPSDDPPPQPISQPTGPLATVSRHEQGGVLIASVRGEVDISNAAELGRELSEISNHVLGLVVDISGVTYLDSAGVALLHELHLRLERRGQILVVVAPASGAPRRVLEITAFDTRASISDDVSVAVAVIRGRQRPRDEGVPSS